MDRKLILDFDRKQKQKQKSHKHKHSTKRDTEPSKTYKKAKKEPDYVEPSTSYRDRAQERREGINKDFELDPDDLIISNPIAEGVQSVDEAEQRRQQIEESKYLGGDVEHTHLVKGLDFALLEKIKASEKLATNKRQLYNSDYDLSRELLLGGSDSDEEELTKEALLAANATTTNKRQIDIGKLRASEIIPCRTAFARRILNALDERWPERSEFFLPGRMSYIVPIEEGSESHVTTILRSKVEQQEGETSNEKDLAIDQLINIFAKIRKQK